MKLCIAGKNNIAVDCLYYAIKFLDKRDICVVLNNTDSLKNTWQKSLGFYAKRENIKILTLEEVQKISNITFLSLEFDRLLKPERFKSEKLYNIHFSLLPEYKGMYTSLLPILHGKKYSGVTLHEIDNGIDTGNIITQKKFNISKYNCRGLYFRYLEEGTKLVCKKMEDLIDKRYKSTVQPSSNSTYFSKKTIDFNELEINPFQTADQIKRFVDAFTFREYQLPIFNNSNINKARINNKKSNKKAGYIVKEDDFEIEISTIDYNVILTKDYFNQLINCCQINDYRTAKKIIDKVTNIEESDLNGWNPLIIAAFHGSFEVVKLLIERGANPNSKNLNDTSVLMYAKDAYSRNKNFSIIKLLIDNNVDINSADINGKTIFDYTKDKELVNYLRNKA